MSQSPILIITNKLDAHADLIIDELSLMNCNFIRFHPDEMGQDSFLTLKPKRSEINIRSSNKSFAAEEIHSVWYRRPEKGARHFEDEISRNYAIKEYSSVIQEIIRRAPGLIVSHPADIKRSSEKLMQLSWAESVGLNVPEFIISSEISLLLEFCKRHPAVVMKPMSPGNCIVDADDKIICLQTVEVKADTIKLLGDEFSHTPVMLQKLIPRTRDIRITCIGSEVYSVAIDPGPGPVDSRGRWLESRYETIICPRVVAESIDKFMKQTGLKFSAFDFILDEHGEWWFLECNPNGQFLWLEQKTGIPLARAMAHYLLEGRQ
jgi:glutathione synthase/RimK-type ligase-like ATP-grasp enzyme